MADERRNVYTKLNRVFSSQQLFLSQIGRDIDTPAIDVSTGTWVDKGLYAKSPRFIVQLAIDAAGTLEAGQFKQNSTTGKLGYINTSNSQNRVGGLLIRVLPVMILSSSQFEAIPAWEWLLLLTFNEPIAGGGSSDSLDNFFPPSNTINWKSREIVKSVHLKGSALFGWPPTIGTYNYNAAGQATKAITYNEATTAISNYLTFNF